MKQYSTVSQFYTGYDMTINIQSLFKSAVAVSFDILQAKDCFGLKSINTFAK